MPQAPPACCSTFPACDFCSLRYLMVSDGCQTSSLGTYVPGSRMEKELEGTLSLFKRMSQEFTWWRSG